MSYSANGIIYALTYQCFIMALKFPKDVEYGDMFILKEADPDNIGQHREYLLVKSNHSPWICSVVAIAEVRTGEEPGVSEVQFTSRSANSELYNVNYQAFIKLKENESKIVEFDTAHRVEPNDADVLAIFAGWIEGEKKNKEEAKEVLYGMVADAHLNNGFAQSVFDNLKDMNVFSDSKDKQVDTRR